jgi:hypothetical protein
MRSGVNASRGVGAVRKILEAYADRGVFSGFNEARNGRFRFVWVLRQPMELNVDTTKQVLNFRQLLPGIPLGSPLYADVKSFLEQRHDATLPAHRRVDPKRAALLCTNRNGRVSISLRVKNNQYAYGTNRIVNIVHELFQHLRDAYPDYLAENFGAPQE